MFFGEKNAELFKNLLIFYALSTVLMIFDNTKEWNQLVAASSNTVSKKLLLRKNM